MISGHKSLLALPGAGRFTRRRFLLLALLSLAAGGFGSKRNSLADSGPEPCLAPPWLWNAIADRQSAARIGRAYLDAHPQDRRCHELITDIEQTLKKHDASVSLTADAEQTASALQHLLRKEYARDEVVSVAGWVVSKTEARLYALASMSVPPLL